MAQRLAAQGDRSVVVGRDVINSIINTGDHNRFFIGDYERLRDAYIKPWSVFERVRVDRFVGRQWLTTKVDAFLRQEDRGYFVLEADAGLGKTTFLAWLVRERGYIHHFVELVPGLEGVGQGLKNLAAQLVRAWELNRYLAEGVLPGAATRPDFLQTVLTEAAKKRDEARPGERIVLVVDALDEAGVLSGQNVMGLPRVLPEGVYFIVSQRPVSVPLHVEGARRLFRLEAEREENLADMRVYLEAAATWAGVRQALKESGYTVQQFVAALQEKCRGVWVYLHYVVGEIERGERSPLDLAALPEGLWHYYAQYWRGWREQDGWYKTYQPLLGTLAAAQESLSRFQLCALAGIPARPGVERLLQEVWRPFLATDELEGQTCYRLYHASLREFLDGAGDLSQLTEAERSLAREMARATRQAHDRIAERYLAGWGGVDAGLPGLQAPAKRDMDHHYGLRHLAAHLQSAGRVSDVHHLLQVERRCKEEEQLRLPGWLSPLERLLGSALVRVRTWHENTWYVAHEQARDTSGYFSDLDRAWRLAEQTSDRQIRREEKAASVGQEVRYALINASLNTIVANIPQALLVALVAEQVFTSGQGLAYARQMPDPVQRAVALASLAFCLQAPKSTDALHDGVAAARLIRDIELQSKLLDTLASQLVAAGYPNDALAAVQAIQDKRAQAESLVSLARQVAESDFVEQVLRVALELPEDDSRRPGPRSRALAGLARCLAELGHLRAALMAVQAMKDPEWQAEGLAELAPQLTEGLIETALLWTKSNSWLWSKARAVLIPRLAELGHYDDALSRVRSLPASWTFDEARALEITGLARYLPEALLWDALAEAWRIRDKYQRAKAVVGLAPYLTEPQLHTALAAQESLEEPRRSTVQLGSYWDHGEVDRSAALADLVPRLAELGYLKEAVATVREIEQEATRSEMLMELGPSLPESLLRQALDAAREIRNEGHRSAALAGLVCRLAQFGNPEEALAIAQDLPEFALGYGNPRAAALVAIAPHLTEPLLSEALSLVEEMQVATARAEVLAGLASYLPDPLLPRALALAQQIGWDGLRVKALVKLIPRLSGPSLENASETARATEDIIHQAAALSALISHMIALGAPEGALATARLIRHRHYFEDAQTTLIYHWPAKALATALIDLAPCLPQSLLREALAAAREIEWTRPRIEALIGLASYLPDAERIEVMHEALAATREIWIPLDRVRALTDLVRHLPEPERMQALREALEAVQELPTEALFVDRLQSTALVELAPYLPASLLPEAVEMARALPREIVIINVSPQVEALSRLALQLPEPERNQVLQEALATVGESTNEWHRAGVLTRLAPHLPESFLSEWLATLRDMQWEEIGSETLAELAPYLPESLVREVLDVAQEIQRKRHGTKALARLVSRLAELGYPEEALAATRKIDNAKMRAEALAGLTPFLEEPVRRQVLREALEVARTIGAGRDDVILGILERRKKWPPIGRAEALAQLAPQLPEPERTQALQEALAAARDQPERRHSDSGPRAIMLAGLAPFLPEPLRSRTLREGLAAMPDVRDSEDCVKFLTQLTPHLTDQELHEVLSAALAMVHNIRGEDDRAEVLAALVPWLTEPAHLQEAVSLARTMKWERRRVEVLTTIVSRSVELGHLEQAIVAAQVLPELTSDHGHIRAKVLASLAPVLPEALLRDTLEAPRGGYFFDDEDRVQVLIALAAHRTEPLLQKAVEMTGEIRDEDALAKALVGLAPNLSHRLLHEALAKAAAISDEETRARALGGLAPHLPEPLLRAALADAQDITDENHRVWALAELAPHVPEPMLQDMLAAVEEMRNADAKAQLLVAIVPHMPEPMRQKAIEATRAMWNGHSKAWALAMLAQYLPANRRKQVLQEALKAARGIGDTRDRAEVLVRLVPHLAEPERTQVVHDVRALTQALWYERDRAEVLIGLVPHLVEPERTRLMRDIVRLTRSIRYELLRSEARALVAPRLAESGYPKEALAMARAIKSKEKRVETLIKLAQYLPNATRKRALQEAARGVRKLRYNQTEILAGLAPLLAESGYLEQALAMAREIGKGDWMLKAFEELAPYLSESLVSKALEAAQASESEEHRVLMLMGLIPRWAKLGHVDEAWSLTRQLPESIWRYGNPQARVMANLAPHLPETLLREAMEVAQQIEKEETRLEVLVAMTSRLAVLGLHTEALEMVRELPQTVFGQGACLRVKAMVALVRHIPEGMREQVLEEALAAARAIEWEKVRAEALTMLAPHLPEPLCQEVLHDALDAASAIGSADVRAAALAGLVPVLSQLTLTTLYSLWRETLHALAVRTRKELISDLRVLSRVIFALGGEEAVAETRCAIQDVGRWWP